MRYWRIKLPPGVRSPFEVYVNGVRQELGTDYRISEGDLLFERELVRQRLGVKAWLLGVRAVGARFELFEQRLRDARAAHVGEALDLTHVGDRHDPRDDRDIDPDRPRLVDEPEVRLVVEEQLGDQERDSAVDLLLEEPQITGHVDGLGMDLGEGRRANRHRIALGDQSG